MTRSRTDTRLVNSSITLGRKWWTASAALNVAACFGLVLQFYAVASLLSARLHDDRVTSSLHSLVLGVVGLAVQVIFGFAASLLAARGSASVERDLRSKLLAILFSVGAPVMAPALASRLVIEQTRKLADACESWEPLQIQVVLIPLTLAAVIFSVNWLIGLLLFVAAPLIPLNMAVFGVGAEHLSQRQAHQVGELEEMILDRIKGADSLRSLGAVGHERQLVSEATDELRRRTTSVMKVALMSSAALEALVTYAIAMAATYIGLVLLGYVHIAWAPASLNLRSGLFLLLLAPAFFQPFRDLAAAYHERKDVTTVAETLALELGLAESEFNPSTQKRTWVESWEHQTRTTEWHRCHEELPVSSPLIVNACAVSLRYPGSERDTLHEINWDVPRGAFVGVAGSSGSGKTTLLRLATGRLKPTAGTLLRNLDKVAWVSQRPYFFQTSILDNLLIARPDASSEMVWQVLREVGLANVVSDAPKQLDTQLSWIGDGLSGGQARRLALARAILSGSETLILDEPTAHLDRATEASLIEAIAGLVPRITVIVASHSAFLLARCSQVLDLDETRMAEVARVS